jgi:predicted anti-sigma-YlaC factor YlaD
MLTCRELVQIHASDYLDSQLNWGQRAGVRFHLLICERCRRFISQLRLLRGVLALRPEPPPAAEEVTRLAERLYQEQRLHAGPRHE